MPWSVPRGERDDYEIHLVEKNNGTFCIGGRNYYVKPGDIVLLHSAEGNSFQPESPEFRHVFVTFKIRNSINSSLISKFNRQLAEEALPIKPGNVNDLQQLFYQLNKVISLRSEQYAFRLKMLLGTLVLKIREGCMIKSEIDMADEKAPANRYTRDFIDQVVMFLYSNYHTKIRLEDIGHMVNLNPRYLCTVFGKVTGKTIYEYLREIRIEKAKRLLLYTSLGITEIALETGFSSSQYFSNVFRRSEGVEPSVYRKTRTRGASDIYI